MNILHLTPDFKYYDGRSYYVYLLLKYQKRSGHNVYLATNGGDSFDRLIDLIITPFTIPGLSSKSSFLKSSKKISELISDLKIDIIHSHHRYYELLANASAKRTAAHTVFTALSIVDKRYFVEYRSERIIAVSKTVREMLIKKFGVNEKKIRLIPNFVESEEIKNYSPGKNKQLNILTIGRFHKEKNYLTLLEALTLLKNKNITLSMIGEGEQKGVYEKYAAENNLSVEFISPRRDLKKYFEEADICVLSSVRDPLPTFMLQSGLFKKPFIGSNVDGIAEVITDGQNGLSFEKRNAKQLAEKISMFIDNKGLAEKCADELHSIVVKDFTEKKIVPEIMKVYSELL